MTSLLDLPKSFCHDQFCPNLFWSMLPCSSPFFTSILDFGLVHTVDVSNSPSSLLAYCFWKDIQSIKRIKLSVSDRIYQARKLHPGHIRTSWGWAVPSSGQATFFWPWLRSLFTLIWNGLHIFGLPTYLRLSSYLSSPSYLRFSSYLNVLDFWIWKIFESRKNLGQ